MLSLINPVNGVRCTTYHYNNVGFRDYKEIIRKQNLKIRKNKFYPVFNIKDTIWSVTCQPWVMTHILRCCDILSILVLKSCSQPVYSIFISEILFGFKWLNVWILSSQNPTRLIYSYFNEKKENKTKFYLGPLLKWRSVITKHWALRIQKTLYDTPVNEYGVKI